MAIAQVKEYLRRWGKDGDILEFDTSSATVELAAEVLGVAPSRIAKTLSFRSEEGAMLVIAAGDARIDNAKFKSEFGIKAKMLSADEVLEFTGHAVGGVCPFALPTELPVYSDISMQRFTTVYPACGSSNSAIELTCDELEQFSGSRRWVDVCKCWREDQSE